MHNAHGNIIALRDKYRQETGIQNLKITHNNVLGYFIEITASNASKLNNERFIHRQSLANCMRYTTKELMQLAEDIMNCREKISNLEKEIFEQICAELIRHADRLALSAQAISVLDVMLCFAFNATQYKYTRPQISNDTTLQIIAGRHPVVERKLKNDFISNSLQQDQFSYLWLITGPNMAGKSTFLRQNAHIILLAQVGSFVPAEKAQIGIVDKIFSRIGAADDIARGFSTFMVEMLETANILNNATANSFIILDEIGRGTATYDGLALAWAILEYVHNKIKARTLFATHYHELTTLENMLPMVRCHTPEVAEWDDKVIFKYNIIEGKARGSYGIHVASIAGLPKSVINKAKNVLTSFENKQITLQSTEVVDIQYDNDNTTHHAVLEALETLDIDSLSPRDALETLYKLKQLCN